MLAAEKYLLDLCGSCFEICGDCCLGVEGELCSEGVWGYFETCSLGVPSASEMFGQGEGFGISFLFMRAAGYSNFVLFFHDEHGQIEQSFLR